MLRFFAQPRMRCALGARCIGLHPSIDHALSRLDCHTLREFRIYGDELSKPVNRNTFVFTTARSLHRFQAIRHPVMLLHVMLDRLDTAFSRLFTMPSLMPTAVARLVARRKHGIYWLSPLHQWCTQYGVVPSQSGLGSTDRAIFQVHVATTHHQTGRDARRSPTNPREFRAMEWGGGVGPLSRETGGTNVPRK